MSRNICSSRDSSGMIALPRKRRRGDPDNVSGIRPDFVAATGHCDLKPHHARLVTSGQTSAPWVTFEVGQPIRDSGFSTPSVVRDGKFTILREVNVAHNTTTRQSIPSVFNVALMIQRCWQGWETVSPNGNTRIITDQLTFLLRPDPTNASISVGASASEAESGFFPSVG